METFGQRLKMLRKNAGMTQEQLAERLNISFQAISKWENDQTNPDLSLILPLAQALSVSTDLLLGACTEQNHRSLNDQFVLCSLKDDDEGALLIAEEALRLFPSDISWLTRRAICEKRLFNELPDGKEKEHYGALAEEHYRALYEKALTQRAQGFISVDSSGEHLSSILSARGKTEEAKKIACSISGKYRDSALKQCLVGKEKSKHHHHTISMAAIQFRNELISDGSTEAYLLALRFLDMLYSKPSISYYRHSELIHSRFAVKRLEEGNTEEALRFFEISLDCAHKESLLYEEQQENCIYSEIFFDRYPVNSDAYAHCGNALGRALLFAPRVAALAKDPRFDEVLNKYMNIYETLPNYEAN